MEWRTSSFCANGGCIEVTSSFCSSGGCVSIEPGQDFILVRDTKDRALEPIAVARRSWASTVLAPIMLDRLPSTVFEVTGGVEWRGHTPEGDEQFHYFTGEEWSAFVKGVKAGEFNPEVLGG